MPFWLAVVLLILTVSSGVLCCRYLRKSKAMCILCLFVCLLLALACILYIGLTILFVNAVQNQPPLL